MNNLDDQKDKNKNPETTGHSWDGVQEYNTPTPRWWLIVWAISIVWAVIYWFFFPTWPTIKDHTKGVLKWNSRTALENEVTEVNNTRNIYLKEFETASFEEIQKNPTLLEFALNGGKIAFENNCAACHGSGGSGSKGFPNLNDDDWLWGGKIEEIHQTLLYGIRSGHEKTRESQMPAFGRDKILNKEQISNVVKYVRSLSKLDEPNLEGQKIFADNCAVCHGKNATGGREFGAPNLTDAIWLYGSDEKDVTETVYYARRGVMPNWGARLDNNTIKQLAIYIHSLGGGE